MRVRRYPLVAQAFIAAWLPICALATAEIYPNTSFDCERSPTSGLIECQLEESTPFHRRITPIEATTTTIKTFEYGFEELGIGHERFDVPIERARRIKVEYDAFLHAPSLATFSVSLRSMQWLYWLCAAFELFVVGFYLLAQVCIRLEADLDEGTLAIERSMHLRKVEARRIVLADVDTFRIDDLTDDAKGHAVVARMWSGQDQVLLTTVSGEAVQTLRFLQNAKARAAA